MRSTRRNMVIPQSATIIVDSRESLTAAQADDLRRARRDFWALVAAKVRHIDDERSTCGYADADVLEIVEAAGYTIGKFNEICARRRKPSSAEDYLV